MVKSPGTNDFTSLSYMAAPFEMKNELPTTISPYLNKITEAELSAVMVDDLATIACGVVAVYAQIFGASFAQDHVIIADIAQHILHLSVQVLV